MSEILGFVLIFALVTSMIAVVFTVGFGGLQSTQQAEQVNNVERAFDVLDDNLKDLYQRDNFDGGDLSRATEIKLASGGSIAFDEPVTFVVETGNLTESYSSQPIVYSDESDTQIVYEAGAVIRVDGDASLMRSGPANIHGVDRMVVSILNLRQHGERNAMTGGGTMLITGQHRNTHVADFEPEENVTITVHSPRTQAWEQYFESKSIGTVSSDPGNETVSYTFAADRVSVVETRLRLRLSR